MSLPRLDSWSAANGAERWGLYESISASLPDGFKGSGQLQLDQGQLPCFVQLTSGLPWLLVLGHSFQRGLSAAEEEQARRLDDPPPLTLVEMRPTKTVEVKPFLMMRDPLPWSVAEKVLDKQIERRGRPALAGPDQLAPAYLLLPEVEAIAHALGASLPFETQWESACRARSQTLFFFGSKLPEDRVLAGYVNPDLSKATPNPFGFRGLFIGEWCRDPWRPGYDAPPDAASRVIRGGASAFWPWQGSEWAFCVSAMRMPSSDLVGGCAGARLVVEL
jgi:formylglycine-generating enzyme required for sulfatase activity